MEWCHENAAKNSFVINTTAYHSGWYSLHILLLKSSMDGLFLPPPTYNFFGPNFDFFVHFVRPKVITIIASIKSNIFSLQNVSYKREQQLLSCAHLPSSHCFFNKLANPGLFHLFSSFQTNITNVSIFSQLVNPKNRSLF